jgi:hypothetical protein
MANKPEKKFRAGGISAIIWKNQGEFKGKTTEFRTVQIQRNYKDAKNEWQTTNSFRVNDLPKARLVLDKAYEYLIFNETEGNGGKSNQDDIEEEFLN